MLLDPTGVSTLRVTRGVGLGGTIQVVTGVGVGVSSGGSCSYHSRQEHDGDHQAEQDQRNDQRQIVSFRFHVMTP